MKYATHKSSVVVIGAGAAGLAAAAILARAGHPVVILEARRRIGGRVRTLQGSVFGRPVEAGAEFIHGRPEATFDLVHRFGLTACEVPFDHLQRKHGRLERLEDFSAAVEPVMAGLAGITGPDVSFAQYLRTHARHPRHRDARAMATAFVQGFDAADPELISARSLAREQEGLGDVDERQFRILEGYGELMHRLAHSAVELGALIRLGAAVERVNWCENGAVVFGRGAHGAPFEVHARRVIVTLPLGVLALEGGEGAVRFTPDIAEKRRAMQRLAFGPVVKALLRFDRAFWEEPRAARLAKAPKEYRDLSFMNDPAADVPTWWSLRPLRTAILVGWAGGPKAQALSGLPSEQILDRALRSLSGLTGFTTAKLRSMITAARVCDWLADPWSRGAYSYEAVGGSRARAALAKPLAGTLFFAGEATDTEGQASTVAGAIASGERAASEIVRCAGHDQSGRTAGAPRRRPRIS